MLLHDCPAEYLNPLSAHSFPAHRSSLAQRRSVRPAWLQVESYLFQPRGFISNFYATPAAARSRNAIPGCKEQGEKSRVSPFRMNTCKSVSKQMTLTGSVDMLGTA